MRVKEDYTPLISLALGLTVAILILFQIYILGEPNRIAGVEAHDRSVALSAGQALFQNNCAICHGDDGEGTTGRPALNDKQFLAEASDERIFSLISSGVPSTEMPAWNQVYGGPLTDEQIRQLAAFIRSWEPNAPDRQAMTMMGDPVSGLVIFNSRCIVCHGESGQGTDLAPALNDPVKLAQLDDEWYADTIAQGRPAQGMPTWGTVLSPGEIRDLVALLRAWQSGETLQPSGP